MGDVATSYPANVTPTDQTAPAPLTTFNQNIAEHCGAGPKSTATIAATQNAAGTQGTITITLPIKCRGTTLTFNTPGLQFASVNSMATGMALKTNPPWTGGTAGSVTTCVSAVGKNCATTQMVLTSGGNAAPTSVVNIANGRNFGPWVQTAGLTAGESATITLYLYLEWRNTATGDHAVIQVDQVTLVVNQL